MTTKPAREMRATREKYTEGPARVVINELKTPTPEGRFMLAILERWSMVQGVDGGEDSAGRAKINLMPVDELVDRAADISIKAFKALEDNDWFMDLPTFDEMENEIKEREDKRENK